MSFLDSGLDLVRQGATYRKAAETLVERCEAAKETPPGFGHRYHTRDPRAARLFQMALELEVEGHHVQMIRAVEMVMADHPDNHGRAVPVNIDGAIAAVCGDLGIPAAIADALFVISRVPGIAAHAEEERNRQAPMRQIDPKDHRYDGPSERRIPERRK
jgi:citrate synthase